MPAGGKVCQTLLRSVGRVLCLRPWAHKWINYWSLWLMASTMPDPELPSELQGITAPWPVPNYTAWYRGTCVWITCPRLLPFKSQVQCPTTGGAAILQELKQTWTQTLIFTSILLPREGSGDVYWPMLFPIYVQRSPNQALVFCVNFAFSYIVFQINVFICCVKVSFFSTRLLAQRLAGKHACIMTYLVSSKTHNSNLHSVDKRVRCRHRLVNSHKAWVQHYDRATLWRQLRQHVFLQPSEHNDQTATTDNDTARQLKLTAHT